MSLEEVAVLRAHEERVWHVSWGRGGLLATSSADKTIRIWQEDAGGVWRVVSTLDDAHERSVRCVEFSACGKLVAGGSFDATVTIWCKRVEGLELEWDLIATLEGHENEVKGVAWNAATTMLATCARDRSVWLWDVDDEFRFELLTVLHGHAADVKAVAFLHEGLLASASYDNTLKLWVDDGQDDWLCAHTLEGHDSTVWDCCWGPRGLLVSVSDDRSIKLWGHQRLAGTNKPLGGGAGVSDDDDDPALGSDNASDDAANPAAYAQLVSLDKAHSRSIYSVHVHTDGLMATAGGDNALRVFRILSPNTPHGLPSLRPLATKMAAHDADINCIRFHPSRPNLLASAGDDTAVRLWRLVAPMDESSSVSAGL